MSVPKVLKGSYVAGDRKVVYYTRCEHCIHLKECRKGRAPMATCKHVADVEFFVGGVSKVAWSGVIVLKDIQRIVHDYLETDPPPDVAMATGMEQLEMEL